MLGQEIRHEHPLISVAFVHYVPTSVAILSSSFFVENRNVAIG